MLRSLSREVTDIQKAEEERLLLQMDLLYENNTRLNGRLRGIVQELESETTFRIEERYRRFVLESDRSFHTVSVLAISISLLAIVLYFIIHRDLKRKYRYQKELEEEMPEVDKFYGKFNYKQLLQELGKAEVSSCNGQRHLTTPRHYAYIKIAEGCNRHCAYCAIPIITGKHVSRPKEEILQEVRELVEEGKLTGGHARALVPLTADMQQKAAAVIVKDDLSVRQTELLVKKLTAEKKDKPAKDPTAVDYAAEAARELGERLGRPCKIVTGKKKGRIELEYFGMDDLNALLEALHQLKH